MPKVSTVIVSGTLVFVGLATFPLTHAGQNSGFPPKEPVAQAQTVTKLYFGVAVKDPYQYMENMMDPYVRGWLRKQSDYAAAELARIPGRAKLLLDIQKYESAAPGRVVGVRRLANGMIFYLKLSATDNTAKLFVRRGLRGSEKLLVDPNRFRVPGGEAPTISYYMPSLDGRYVCYGVSFGGSDEVTLHVFDVRSGEDTGDVIDRAHFGSIAWRSDNHSFLYNRLQKLSPSSSPLERYQKSVIWLHTVGEPSEKDTAVFGWGTSTSVAIAPGDIPLVGMEPGSPYAFGILAHGVQREITAYVAPVAMLGIPGTPWRKICDASDEVTQFTLHGDMLYLLIHKGAPRFKVVTTNVLHPDLTNASTVIPESASVLRSVTAAADAIYVVESDGVVSRLLRIPFGRGSQAIPCLSAEGTIAPIATNDPREEGILYTHTTWTQAPRFYEFDPKTGRSKATHLQPIGPYDSPANIVSEELQVTSYDGIDVPLSVIHEKGMQLNNSNPTIMEAYGAYGVSIDPSFDPTTLAWIKRGGIFAVAHVRGGGEYGEPWYKAGYKLTKPNSWRDLIACAEYLIQHKYTSAHELAILGASAGGITVGRALTERPDLFSVVLVHSGFLNPLRSGIYPYGILNIPEFGSINTEDGFEDLYAMDAYLHVHDRTEYPAVMLTVGMNDRRVAPWMSAKMAARLEAASSSGKPILLRIDYQAGHGFGSTKLQYDRTIADQMAFALWQFGQAKFQPVH